jgi:diguanylate cyclase (GGDEF)-like protein
VLRALADLLVRELRAIDWVGRLGGEEFAIVFSETDLVKAELVCERLLMTVGAMEVDIDVAKISITVSIGLAGVTPATLDSTDILKRADEFMYAAKTGGRNRVEVDTRDEQAPPVGTISARSAQG